MKDEQFIGIVDPLPEDVYTITKVIQYIESLSPDEIDEALELPIEEVIKKYEKYIAKDENA